MPEKLSEVRMFDTKINTKSKSTTRDLVRIAVLGAISFLLMKIKFPIAFVAPPFMTVDISDVPALVAGFAMGPGFGVLVQFLKNLLDLPTTMTAGVGNLSNFIVGSTFVIVSSLIYRKNKDMKNALIGLVVGVLAMSALAMASNYFVVFPLYAKVMIPMETLIGMGQAIFPAIDSLGKMMILSVLPFNLIKGTINALVTLIIYKRVRKLL